MIFKKSTFFPVAKVLSFILFNQELNPILGMKSVLVWGDDGGCWDGNKGGKLCELSSALFTVSLLGALVGTNFFKL